MNRPAPSPVRRAVRDGLVIAGLLFAAYLYLVVAPSAGTFGFDAFAYWSVDPAAPYGERVGGLAAFNYAPPIAALFGLSGGLPWFAFLWLWLALLVATLVWLSGRSPRGFIWLAAFPPIALELYHGNVHLLIAAAIVLGFRHPWTWSFVLLTKVTPGVGLMWFAVRREWRPLAIVGGVTAAIVAASLALDGARWIEWIGLLARTQAGDTVQQFQIAVPLVVRLPVAAALVAWGAATDRRWTVPVASALALPVLWLSGFAICAALAHPWLRSGPPSLTQPETSTPAVRVPA